MARYIALLRGINISGKNKIPMAALRKEFEGLGFERVRTCLNSGNVLFSSDEEDVRLLANLIEARIKHQFGLGIPVLVLSKENLEDILHHAPKWWGTDTEQIYDQIIFILPPATVEDVFRELGEPKEALEKAMAYNNAIFWSFSRKDYQKTNWWPRTASVAAAPKLTIRTANTVRKIAGMD